MDWIEELRREIELKVHNSIFATQLRRGDYEIMEIELKRFWPFVASFGGMIEAKIGALPTYRRIPQEERSHRDLWAETAKRLGVSLDDPPEPRIQGLCELIASKNDSLPIAFLRFLATEEFATALARSCMSSEIFRQAVGEQGGGWFQAHLEVETPTHSDLFLAGYFYTGAPGGLDMDQARQTVMEAVHKFIELAEEAPAA